MPLHDTVESISSALATLRLQVNAEAKAGLTSRNKTAEHVLLPVLRLVYSSPGMHNTNEYGPNFPGLDLYDKTTGLGVQVTSDTSSTKIAETIRRLVAADLRVKRLVIALIADTKPGYQASTRQQWSELARGHFEFDPHRDVLAFDDLLGRIQGLDFPIIAAVASELEALVHGKHRIHLLPFLREQVDRQLAEETRVGRYIPNIFVETQATKYQARCFGHPSLFVQRIASDFDRQPFAALNRLAVMSGVPPLSSAPTGGLAAAISPEAAAAAAVAFSTDLGQLDRTLDDYAAVETGRSRTVPTDATRSHVLEQTRYYLGDGARGVQWWLKDRCTELASVAARIFLLTGPAGQGKTNFLCDFTERFLLRHEIPCAYVTARQLSRTGDPDLPEVVRKLIFPPAITSLNEGLNSLAAACNERGQPFILVIDGLNEHPDIRAFSGQLEVLLEVLMGYPHVRVLMTCRSEFLAERFGELLSGPLEPVLHVSEAHGQRFDDDQFRDLVVRYFRFFRVRPSLVARNVIELLRRDVLLLRLFCEAYGERDKDETYHQPLVTGVYRGEIFGRYVDEKLRRADRVVAVDRSSSRSLGQRPQTRRILSLVASHMLESARFSDVPRELIPFELNAELAALLDEELILRRDLGRAPSILADPPEVLNFTFDEMRDFMLAQHLLGVNSEDPSEFTRLINAQTPSQAESVEGIQRFLFYASREPDNTAFLATFRQHPWYEAVYDSEVFAIPPDHLTDEDRSLARQALSARGQRAQRFARQLAVRWQSSVYRILNLEFLLDVAEQESQTFFADVIMPTFGDANYGEDSLGKRFCRYVEEGVLPQFESADAAVYEPLFRLLVLLLPVRATPTLDSAAVTAFRALIQKRPAFAVELLENAIDGADDLHRRFIWRLLSESVGDIEDTEGLVEAARADADRVSSDTHLRAEAERFLTLVSQRSRRT
jgi:hypothetical protein